MKKTMHILSALTIAAALTLFTTACSNEELLAEKQQPQAPAAEAPVCYFNIPANIGDDAGTRAVTIGETSITSEFANTDKVYVFIEGQGTNAGKLAVSHNGTDAATYLTPSNINGTTCDLTGALKFYYNDNGNFTVYEPTVNDVVYLFYNMNYPVQDFASSIEGAGLDYQNQNGSKDQDVYGDYFGQQYLQSQGAAAHDFAQAKMKVTEVSGNGTDGYTLTLVQYDDDTKSNVHFENMHSMFRQRLAFTDKNSQPIAVPTLEKLSISFDGGDYVVGGYYPFSSYSTYYSLSQISINNPIISAEGDVYLALMFYDSNKDLPLVLKATDTDGNVYSVTKNAPTGGFKNGKYYYGSATLAWQKCIKPTVTGTSATPTYGRYTITENPFDFTISGNSEDYNFEISEGHGGTITLNNVTASGYSPFIIQDSNNPNADVSLVLTGANSITCNTHSCILVYGNLRLSCTGTSATLTVTGTLDWCCGITGDNYRSDGDFGISHNELETTTALDVSYMLAAPGFSVMRSARADNGDNTYTWTYTVTPTPYSTAAVGKVIGANGVIYDDAAAATTAGTTAEAMIAYVGAQNGVCANGLAISLTDVYQYNATYAEATGNGIIPSWRTYHAIPGGNWKLPTEKDWQYILWGYYTDTPAAAPVGTVKSVLENGYYWSRTIIDDDNAKGIYYDGTTNASIQSLAKTGTWHVRAVFAF